MDLIDWLRERHANTQRIAATKSGDDREGWVEDGEYFQQAIQRIERCASTERELQSKESHLAELQGQVSAGEIVGKFSTVGAIQYKKVQDQQAEITSLTQQLAEAKERNSEIQCKWDELSIHDESVTRQLREKEQRLAELYQDKNNPYAGFWGNMAARECIRATQAEEKIKSLESRNRELVEAIRSRPETYQYIEDGDTWSGQEFCFFCGGEMVNQAVNHRSGCVWEQEKLLTPQPARDVWSQRKATIGCPCDAPLGSECDRRNPAIAGQNPCPCICHDQPAAISLTEE